MKEIYKRIYIEVLKYGMLIKQDGHTVSILSHTGSSYKMVYDLYTHRTFPVYVHMRSDKEEIISISGY